MIKILTTALLLLSLVVLFSPDTHAQPKKTWTEPVLVTEMNGGKIYVSYTYTDKDSIYYKIKSQCQGLKNVYTCFAFEYLDKNKLAHTFMIRDIPLSERFEKEYSIYSRNGISKVVTPYLPETVMAYLSGFFIK
jgi:hypothetical protein